MSEIKTIGILTYQSCSEQDTITPLEIFRGAAMVLSQQIKILPTTAAPQSLEVKLVATAKGNTKMQMGTEVVPNAFLEDSATYDLFYVPGGVGSGALTKNDQVLSAIRHHYEKGKVVASNCSGVGVLFRAGILGDTPVTCVAAIARRLRELGANVPQPRHMWEGLPDSRLWTSTGSYGVHGGAAALVAHYFGRDVASTVGMMFDTLGGLGDAMYQNVGPEFYYHPDLEDQFQSFWENQLLPK
jgi:putative intracellular protease/amidase